jgi:hypothetical protein
MQDVIEPQQNVVGVSKFGHPNTRGAALHVRVDAV